MKETTGKLKNRLIQIGGCVLAAIFVLGFIVDGYTYLIGRVHRVCLFDEVYIASEDDTSVAIIFDGDQMVLYTADTLNSSRISYAFRNGYYYNKGLFGRFSDMNDKWVKIPDAEKAGQFYTVCETAISASAFGDFVYMDKDDIEEAGEENGVNYSKLFFFKESGDSLTLISQEDSESYSLPLTRVKVLTGDMADTIEYLDSLWEYKYGE